MKKLLVVSSVFAIIAGIILICGGMWGISYIYKNIAQENIVTPADATIPEQLVRGPFTLKSQVDIIRKHVLETTGGRTYAEMPREDENRNLWITATTLTTALNLALLTYLFSSLTIVFGCISLWIGFVCYALSRNSNFT